MMEATRTGEDGGRTVPARGRAAAAFGSHLPAAAHGRSPGSAPPSEAVGTGEPAALFRAVVELDR